jgi:hypothetical protein
MTLMKSWLTKINIIHQQSQYDCNDDKQSERLIKDEGHDDFLFLMTSGYHSSKASVEWLNGF